MRGSYNRWARPRGFTLIELLVVVAIISLLISILLPALANAKKQSRQLKCSTNLRSQGQAAHMYAADNNDTIVRGMNDGRIPAGDPADGRAGYSYSISLLKYLAYDGQITELWRVQGHPERFRLVEIIQNIPQFQCPDFPNPEGSTGQQYFSLVEQPLDYVSSAYPIPYTQSQDRRDRQRGGGGRAGNDFREESLTPDYQKWTKLSSFTRYNPGAYIYVTEAHNSLYTDELRFHHVFYMSQLPFGAYPRMANDLRHPGGINAMFFDTHVVTMRQNVMDSGWPNTTAHRLRWFTPVPF